MPASIMPCDCHQLGRSGDVLSALSRRELVNLAVDLASTPSNALSWVAPGTGVNTTGRGGHNLATPASLSNAVND